MKEEKGTKFDTDLTADDLKLLVDEYLALFEKKSGKPFPQDPWEQVFAAIQTVFGSGATRGATMYRPPEPHHRGLIGTAVNVAGDGV